MHAFTMALRLQVVKTGIKIIEVVPPAINTELNAEGRSGRGNYRPDLQPDTFVSGIIKFLENDTPGIGFGTTEGLRNASREELDNRFTKMNRHWQLACVRYKKMV